VADPRAETGLNVVSRPVEGKADRTPTPAGEVLAGVYAAGVLLSLARLMLSLWRWRLLRRGGRVIANEVEPARQTTRRALDLRRTPLVLEADIAVPCVVGLWSGAVLLPRSWRNWDSATLDSVLTHEFSHIGRHDALFRFGAVLYRGVFWFSPAAWW